jgi:hypothetical protein
MTRDILEVPKGDLTSPKAMLDILRSECEKHGIDPESLYPVAVSTGELYFTDGDIVTFSIDWNADNPVSALTRQLEYVKVTMHDDGRFTRENGVSEVPVTNFVKVPEVWKSDPLSFGTVLYIPEYFPLPLTRKSENDDASDK